MQAFQIDTEASRSFISTMSLVESVFQTVSMYRRTSLKIILLALEIIKPALYLPVRNSLIP